MPITETNAEIVDDDQEQQQAEEAALQAAADADEGSTTDEADAAEGDDSTEGEAANDDGGELSITLGDAPEEGAEEQPDDKQAPTWLKELRRSNKELVRTIRSQEAELSQLRGKSTPAAPQTLGPEPDMSDADVDYDEQKFKAKWKTWQAQKTEIEAQQRKQTEAAEQQTRTWHKRLVDVEAASKSMNLSNQQDAIESFDATFSVAQRGIILGGFDDPKASAQLRYVLGRNPAEARKLAGIEDLVKFTIAVANTMNKMKVSPRKSAPAPDTVLRSGTGGKSTTDNRLEQLQKEADRTGDRTKVAAYIRQTKNKAAA